MDNGKVSIVIPFYNEEEKIDILLSSVLQLQYSDYEVVLINDGSTDSSDLICEKYVKKSSKFRLINQPNLGKSSARNRGIDEATGDWIWFVDADDEVFENALNIFFETIDTKTADCIVGEYIQEQVAYKSDCRGIIDAKEFLEKEALHRWDMYYCVLWNKLFKKSVIYNNHIRFDEFASIWAQDNLFILAYVEHCNTFACVNGEVYRYIPPVQNMVSQSYERNKRIYQIQCLVHSKFMKCLKMHGCNELAISKTKEHFYIEMRNQYIKLLKESKESQKLLDEIWDSAELRDCLEKDTYDGIKCKELKFARFCIRCNLKNTYKYYIKFRY